MKPDMHASISTIITIIIITITIIAVATADTGVTSQTTSAMYIYIMNSVTLSKSQCMQI